MGALAVGQSEYRRGESSFLRRVFGCFVGPKPVAINSKKGLMGLMVPWEEDNVMSWLFLAGAIHLFSMGPGVAKWRILVVDNEPLVTESIKWILVHDGHLVEVTSSGEQALRLFEKGKFDLIIADYEMPKLKGDELAVRIRVLDPDQRVLLITAHTEELISAKAPLRGVDMVLSKPFDIEELRRAVAQLATKC